jgi:predicted ATPase
MKIIKLDAKYFRHMRNIHFEFGDELTVISGLNGTGKSSILGLIGQVYDYKVKLKTINNNDFSTKYSDIFKFCETYDQNNIYQYEVDVFDGENHLNRKVKSRYVKKEKRFRMDIGERQKLKGALNHPVIYLGLRRLFPLAQEIDGSINTYKHSLSPSEERFYEENAKSIFVMLEENIIPETVKSPNKEFLAMHTKKYSNLGNSAGQDNIGQIITAILSFRRLSEKSGYTGGILLIDELETTLFAGAQINFLGRLFSYAKQFKLQIIFTTHSLEIIKYLQEKDSWNTKINFLEIRDGNVINSINPKFSYIQSRILLETKKSEFIIKKQILCEDELAKKWVNNLLNRQSHKKQCETNGSKISDGIIKTLAESKMKCFKDFIFVIDGDGSKNPTYNKIKNIVFLPGKYRPETIMYNYLKSLSDSDEFWGGENNFFKDTCFRGYDSATGNSRHKAWFYHNKENFGVNHSKLFNRWRKDNIDFVNSFNKQILMHI